MKHFDDSAYHHHDYGMTTVAAFAFVAIATAVVFAVVASLSSPAILSFLLHKHDFVLHNMLHESEYGLLIS